MPRSCQDATRTVHGGFGVQLREFNDQDDHLRPLAAYPSKAAAPALANSLKGMPARRLRSEFTGPVNRHITHGHFWSPSSFAASCGGAPLSIIRTTSSRKDTRLTQLPG
jgi:putative transposase